MSVVKKILGRFFGSKSERDLKILKPVIDQVNFVTPEIEILSDDGLRKKTFEFQEKI